MTAAERERKKKQLENTFPLGFQKKKCFGNFTFSKGSLFFFWAGKKKHSICRRRDNIQFVKKTFMTKFAINVEKS